MSFLEVYTLRPHLAPIVLVPKGWWLALFLLVMGPCLRHSRGCGSLQTLSRVCTPLNQRLNVVWTLGEGKVGDFASEWEGGCCGHF